MGVRVERVCVCLVIIFRDRRGYTGIRTIIIWKFSLSPRARELEGFFSDDAGISSGNRFLPETVFRASRTRRFSSLVRSALSMHRIKLECRFVRVTREVTGSLVRGRKTYMALDGF